MSNQRGFTLMEFIGVMAVMAILSAAMAPSIFDAMNNAYSEAEERNLGRLAEDLETYLLTTRSLPSPTAATWSTALASVSDQPIAMVLRNRRNFQRTLYYDPRFFINSDTNFTGYTQVDGLASAPFSPRAMLISNMTANAASPAMNSATFDAIWDQTAGASVVESNDIKIVRVNMARHFQRVVLSNAAGSQVGYGLDGSSIFAVAANNGTTDGILERHVISGSALQLYTDPYPTGALGTVALIREATGYRYVTNGTEWFWEAT